MRILLLAEVVSPRMGAERVVAGVHHELQRRGHEVTILDPRSDLTGEFVKPDIVHWFATGSDQKASLALISELIRRGIPVVATTTLWPYTPDVIESAFEGMPVSPGEISTLADMIHSQQLAQAKILDLATVAIATSDGHAERANQVLEKLGFRPMDFEIVHNAVNKEEILEFPLIDWDSRLAMVLCLARIEAWKNQRRLLQAVSALRERISEVRLVLAGKQLLRLEAQRWCDILDEVSPFLGLSLASMARIHALPSLGDFPGLASLEAAALGCQIVASKPPYSTLAEYIPDAIFVDPTNVGSIAVGLYEAWRTPPPARWRELILERFTYERAVDKLLEIYGKLL